jgi:hypothetical protein
MDFGYSTMRTEEWRTVLSSVKTFVVELLFMYRSIVDKKPYSTVEKQG